MDRTIRCATKPDGNIEAAYIRDGTIRNVVICCRTGDYLGGSSKYGDDDFRSLIRAARQFIQI